MSAMKDRKDAFPVGIRRALAVVAVSAVALAGWQITTGPHLGIGAFGIPGATADPTGPPGPTGGMTDGGGSQFQPPGMPSAMPDYQGGNQPPLNQNNGISIYNTGTQGAPQQGGQQGAQAQQEAQQPAHGTQMPDYQTATPYTQGPGHENPNYQPSQQVQQPQQQGQQQQQPSQAPTQSQQPQNKEDDTTRQLNDQRQQKCHAAMLKMGNTAAAALVSVGGMVAGGGGRNPVWFKPWLDPTTPTPSPCDGSCPQETTQKQEPDTTQKQKGNEQEQNKKEDNEKQEKCQPNDFVPANSGNLSPEDAAKFKEFADKARQAMNKIMETKPGMQRDHVIPLRRLWDIPGFKNLSSAAQIFIANNPDNLKHIPSGWNSSKQDRLWSEPWEPGSGVTPPLTPEDRAKLCGDEIKATETVKKEMENEAKRKPKSPQVPGVPKPPTSDEINDHKNDTSWLKDEEQKLMKQINDVIRTIRLLETDDQGRNVGYPQYEDQNMYTYARDVLDILGEREYQVTELIKNPPPPASEPPSWFPGWLPIPVITWSPVVVPI